MTDDLSIHALWTSTPASARVLQPDRLARLPEPVRRYLEHAIPRGTPLASAVRLRMHGEIRLRRWFPFTAEQVIRWDRGMIWRATVRMWGVPVRGFDRLVDGQGEMQWKLLGIIPIIKAAGPDITRSAAGRVAGESVWLPSALAGDAVSWTARDSSHAHASFTVAGEHMELALTIGPNGRLERISFKRWGNPEGGEFRYADFGCLVENERTFGAYTIPSGLRAGWHFGAEAFESGDEFFRVIIENAQYR
jgi:hypothetical protein